MTAHNSRRFAAVAVLAIVAAISTACATGSTSTETVTKPAPLAGAITATITNLQAAYDQEMNTSAYYTEFAAKADRQGYRQVANLFRAAARAESIHAENHARAMRDLDITPATESKPIAVLDTETNLKTAIAGETWERDTTYPQFIARAKKARLENAATSFNYASKTELAHQTLFIDAIKHLGAWRAATKPFYVCGVCGNTVTALDFDACSICKSPKDSFTLIK
jgi:rubrerythrin